jgi:hypothetical protein
LHDFLPVLKLVELRTPAATSGRLEKEKLVNSFMNAENIRGICSARI